MEWRRTTLARYLLRALVMDTAYITAFAALGGAALGGLTSFTTSWTTVRAQMKAERNASSKTRRQDLYKHFIEESSRIYGDALVHNNLELAGLIGLYSLISMMRILSSLSVVERAVKVVSAITDTYEQPNKTPEELGAMIHHHSVDLLQDFSNACRREFESIV